MRQHNASDNGNSDLGQPNQWSVVINEGVYEACHGRFTPGFLRLLNVVAA